MYAAFNTKTGEVMGKTASCHTSAEFVAFLTDIVASQPKRKDIHLIARGVFTSVADLKRKRMRYSRKYNEEPKPVKWKYCDLSRRITSDSIVSAH